MPKSHFAEEASPQAPGLKRFEGYQVMVNGRETDITTTSREEAIHQLGLCINRMEQMDEMVETMTGAIKDWRYGRDTAPDPNAEPTASLTPGQR